MAMTRSLMAIGCVVALLSAIPTSRASATPCEGHFCSLGYAKYGWLENPCNSFEQREALQPLLDLANHVIRELIITDEYPSIRLTREQWNRIMDAFSCPAHL